MNYTVQGHSILGFQCVSMRNSPDDQTLAGERGEIWRHSPTHCQAYIVQPSGSEQLYLFENKDLKKWRKRLKIPLDPREQLRWANTLR